MVILCSIVVSCSSKLPAHFYNKTLKEAVYVDNNKNDYTLHFNNDSTSKIWYHTSTDTVQLQKSANDSIRQVKNLKQRPYFNLLSNTNTISIVSNRSLYFKQVVNFRDIGGLRTKEGKTVKWGMIYRSDNLSKLKTGEFNTFRDLHIKTVFDLRTAKEIKGKEDHLPENTIYIHSPTVEDNADMLSQMRAKVIRGEITEEQSIQLMLELYQGTVSDNITPLKKLINQILDSDEPVLYHCSAGKDRTGIVTAVVLSILNVDRETIMNEYLLSNYYRREKIEKLLGLAKTAKVIRPHIGIKVIQNFMSVDERYLDAAFEEIDKQYGGIDQFIKQVLGIDDAKRSLIIAKFTY